MTYNGLNYTPIPEPADPGYVQPDANAATFNAVFEELSEAIGDRSALPNTQKGNLVAAYSEAWNRLIVSLAADGKLKPKIVKREALDDGAVGPDQLGDGAAVRRAIAQDAIDNLRLAPAVKVGNLGSLYSPASSVTDSLNGLDSLLAAHGSEIAAARTGYGNLAERLAAIDVSVLQGSASAQTLFDGMVNEGDSTVAVISSTNFKVSLRVVYLRADGELEYNTISAVPNGTSLLFSAPVGSGGINNRAILSSVSPGEVLLGGAVPHGIVSALTPPQALRNASQDIVNVLSGFGAAADGAFASVVTIKAGSYDLYSSGAAWQLGCDGDVIVVPGAGASGAGLHTTIASYVSSTHIVLTDAAVTTVGAITQVRPSGGTGYNPAGPAPAVAVDPPGAPGGVQAVVSAIINDNGSLSYHIDNPGSGYFVWPTLAVDPPTVGVTATAVAVSNHRSARWGTDNAPAFRAARDIARETLSKHLHIPSGTYLCTEPVLFQDFPDLIISGAGDTVILYPSDDTSQAYSGDTPDEGGTALSNAQLRSGFILRGCHRAIVRGISFVGGTDINLTRNNTGAAIYISDSSDVRIADCHHRYHGGHLFQQDAYASDRGLRVEFCTAYGCRTPNVAGAAPVILACRFEQPTDSSYDRYGTSGSTHALYIYAGNEVERNGVLVSLCSFINFRESGVKFSGTATPTVAMVVSNNYYERTRFALTFGADDVQEHGACVFSGNVIREQGVVSILGSTSALVLGNSWYFAEDAPRSVGAIVSIARYLTGGAGSPVEMVLIANNQWRAVYGAGQVTAPTKIANAVIDVRRVGQGAYNPGGVTITNNMLDGAAPIGIISQYNLGLQIARNTFADIQTEIQMTADRMPVVVENHRIQGPHSTSSTANLRMTNVAWPTVRGNSSAGRMLFAAAPNGTYANGGWLIGDGGGTVADLPFLGQSGWVLPAEAKMEVPLQYGGAWSEGDWVDFNGSSVFTYHTSTAVYTATSITNGGYVVNDSGGNFTAREVGKYVTITDPTGRNTLYLSQIAAVNSATQLTMATPAPATLSGLRMVIGTSSTIGTGAMTSGSPTLTATGEIPVARVTRKGKNYIAPGIVFVGGGVGGATPVDTATATIATDGSGGLGVITMTHFGSGYVTAPTAIISDAAGTGGAVAAILRVPGFSADDVGKTFVVAGAAGSGVSLVATAIARVSATQITLNINASATVNTARTHWGVGPGPFGSQADLTALLDNASGFEAADYGAAKSISTGYIRVRKSSAGTGSFYLAVHATNPTAGVLPYNGSGISPYRCNSRGGEASGNGTLWVLWSPLAQRRALLMPENDAAATLLAAKMPYPTGWVSTDVGACLVMKSNAMAASPATEICSYLMVG